MVGLHCARWSSLRLLSSPWAWLGALLGAGLWGLASEVGPPGISTESAFLARAHYELAFLGALLGAAVGMSLLASLEALLGPARAGARLIARLVTLLVASTWGCLLVGLPPLALHSPVQPLALLAAAGPGVLHLSSLGLALQCALPRFSVSSSSGSRSLLLVGAAWLLPAVLGGLGGPLQGLAHLFEVSVAFQLRERAMGPHLGAILAPILVWLLVATLLELRRSTPATPMLHALRNPG